jgi:hypothetical protein
MGRGQPTSLARGASGLTRTAPGSSPWHFGEFPNKLRRVTLQPDLASVTPASPQVAALLSANGARCPIRPFC